ncbi:MAG: AAA-like domain-containing protein [Cyanobacteria bacterium P01_H01_bin.26]
MEPDEVLRAIEEHLLKRKLTPAERIVLGQTWNKQTYEQMAKQSGYGDAHLKDTGYKLWRVISKALGQRVTKKSLLFVLREHFQSGTSPSTSVQSTVPPVLDAGSRQYQYPSGPLPPGSPLYIERPPNEDLAYAEIHRPGGFLRIKAPQKMGKTSLVFRLIHKAHQQRYQTVHLDLQTIDRDVFSSIDTFLKWFCAQTSRALNLPSKLDEYWDASMGHKVSSELYYQEYLLENRQTPVVLIIGAAERLIEHPKVAEDFFPLLRSWHEKARWNFLWRNLRIVIVHATEIYVPLKINQSPFNIGQAIKLPKFTADQVTDLANRYGVAKDNDTLGQTLVDLVDGHPYLVNIFLYHLTNKTETLTSILKTASTPSGIYGTHLRSYLALLKEEQSLAAAFKQTISSEDGMELDAVTMYRLESLGLIKVKGYQAVPSCEVYRAYFQQQLSF